MWGDRSSSFYVDLEPYASKVVSGRMSLEDAINAAGADILLLLDGEFELIS